MAVLVGLGCVAAFFVVSMLALVRGPFGTMFVYAASGAIALVGLVVGATELIAGTTSAVILPFGLAMLGGHFRIDALSAPSSSSVVDLGGAVTSLYALGYGRHENRAHAGAAVSIRRSWPP